MKNLKLAISNEVIESKDSLYVTAYLYLQALTKYSFTKRPLVADNIMMGYIFGDKITDYNVRKFKTIKPMLYKGKITRLSRDDYDINKSNFTLINLEDIDKMEGLKPEEIHLFLLMMKTCNYTTKVGYTSESKFAEQMGVSAVTICKYVKSLEDHELLYVKRYFDQNITNVYGSYSNKSAIDLYCKKLNIPTVDPDKGNNRRRIAMLYNQYVKTNGEKFDPDRTRQLYEDVVKYNEEMDRLQASCSVPGYYSDRKKDLSVFST